MINTAKAWLNDNIKYILFDKIYYTKGERKALLPRSKTA